MNWDDFDFKPVSEEPESLDYENLTPCPWCKKPIPQDATLCYYCGKETSVSKKSSWVVWVAIVVIVAFSLFLLSAV